LSALLTATTTRFPEARSRAAISLSSGTSPSIASATKRTVSACSIASCAWRRAIFRRVSEASKSMPPVSTTVKRRPAHSAVAEIRSRVIP